MQPHSTQCAPVTLVINGQRHQFDTADDAQAFLDKPRGGRKPGAHRPNATQRPHGLCHQLILKHLAEQGRTPTAGFNPVINRDYSSSCGYVAELAEAGFIQHVGNCLRRAKIWEITAAGREELKRLTAKLNKKGKKS